MEGRFGHSFADVRVHADSGAAAALGARAFTVGSDVAFARGEFAPRSADGRALLAHELAHVVQQGEGRRVEAERVPEAAAERAAARAAEAAMGGRPVEAPLATGLRVARQPKRAGREGPSLTEQGALLLRKYARILADVDRRGCSGLRLTVVNRGTALDPTVREVVGESGPRPAGLATLTETAAADVLRDFIENVVARPGVYELETGRDTRGVMGGRYRWNRVGNSPVRTPVPGPAVAVDPDSTIPDEVKQAMHDRQAWARQQQQVIASTIAEQDPTKLRNLVWYLAPFAMVKTVSKVGKATGMIESTEGMVSTAGRAERLAAEAKQARLAKIRAMAQERYVEGTARDVEIAEAESEVVARPPETPPVRVDPRVRGFAHEDVVLKFGDVRATPNWFRTIDGYVADSAARTYSYVEDGRTILVYERPDIVSHKSTTITDPQRLNAKIIKDLDGLRGFNRYRRENIEIVGAGRRRLVFTIDEEAALTGENVETLESWRRNLSDVQFEWYVSRGSEMVPGPQFVRALRLLEE